MAHGVPAVIGTGGSLPELAGAAALRVDPEDVTSIFTGLEKLLADRSLRDKLGAAGKRRATRFTWRRAAAKTREVLRRIGSPAPSPASRTMV
jgi:glycosyltransferase involved in cell wall biosynthesis